MPSRQRDEHVFERGAVSREQTQRRPRSRNASSSAGTRRWTSEVASATWPSSCRTSLTPGSRASCSSAGQLRRLGDGERDHMLGAEASDQRLRRPERDQRAVVHDADAIAQRVRLVHVVRRQQHRAAGSAKAIEHAPQLAALDCGSSPVVGSSRKSRSGRPAIAHAIDSRCFCPPESLPTHGVALRFELDRLEQLVDGGARIVERAKQTQRLCDGQLVGELRFLQLDAESLAEPCRRCLPNGGRGPRRRPASAASSPSRISIDVVLPAPFGPSRPKHSPRCTSRSRPLTATTSAYRFTRSRQRTTASALDTRRL